MAGKSKTIVTKLTLDDSAFSAQIKNVQKGMLSFSAVVTAAGAAAFAAAKYTANFQDDMIKSSRAAGVATKEFSELAYAAKFSGVSTETLSKSLSKLNSPSKEAVDAFKNLGVNMRDAQGQAKNSAQLLGDVADKFAKISDPAEKSRVAVQLFGEKGRDMVNMLNGGSKALSDAAKEAAKFGQVVSQDAGEAAEKFNDDLARIGEALSGVRNAVGESVIAFVNKSGVMEQLSNVISGLISSWRGLSDETRDTILQILAGATAVAGLVAGFTALAAILPALTAGFALMFGPVGLVVAGVTALAAGVVYLIGTTKEAAETTEKMTQRHNEEISSVKSLEGVYQSVAGKKRENAQLSVTQSDAIKKLKEVADRYNVSLTNELGVYKSLKQIRIEILKAQRDEIVTKMNAIRITRDQIQANLTAIASSREWQEMLAKWGRDWQKSNLGASFNQATMELNRLNDSINSYGIQINKMNIAIAETSKESEKLSTSSNSIKEKIDKMDELSITTQKTTRYTHELVDAFEEFNEVLFELKPDKYIYSIGDSAIAAARSMSALANVAQQITGPMVDLAESFAADIQYSANVALRNLEVVAMRSAELYKKNRESLEKEENAKIRDLTNSYDQQIDALRSGENAKTAAIEFAMNERLLLLNQEYQQARKIEEEAFKKRMEDERIRFETEKQLLLEKSIDKEQRQLVAAQMDADWRAYAENQQREHENKLNDLAKEFAANQKSIDAEMKLSLKIADEENKAALEALQREKSEALAAAEEEKNRRLKELDEARTAQEKEEEKKRLQIQYNAEVDSFNQTKAVKIADTIASSIAAAAQAYAALAPIPIVGHALGLTASATILALMANRVSQLRNQKPIKPAGLMLEDGGYIGGNFTHDRGGIPAEIESGEFVIDRRRTAMLYNAIEKNSQTQPINIYFQDGAIRGMNIDNEETAEKIGVIIGQQLRRQGIAA